MVFCHLQPLWGRPSKWSGNTYYTADDLKTPVSSPRAMVMVDVFRGERPPEMNTAALLRSALRAEADVPVSTMAVISSQHVTLTRLLLCTRNGNKGRTMQGIHDCVFVPCADLRYAARGPEQGPPTTEQDSPLEWEPIIVRKTAGEPATFLGLPGPQLFNSVDSIVWIPPRSTSGRAPHSVPRSAEALLCQPAAVCVLLTDILGVAHASWEKRKDPHCGSVTQYSLQLEDAGGTAMPYDDCKRESLIDRLTKAS